jgi:PAS domain S-box-containing protein
LGLRKIINQNKCAESLEEASKECKQTLRGIFGCMLDGLVLTNIEGKVLDCNEALLEMVGITKEECIGKNAFDSVPPEYKQEITQQVQKVLEKGHCRAETKALKKDGSVFDVEFSAFLLTENRGHPKGFIVVVRDITDRKQAEKELKQQNKQLEKLVKERTAKVRQSEERYRELYESFDEAFIAVDWNMKIIHWNKAAERLTTMTAKNTLGKEASTIIPKTVTISFDDYLGELRERKPVRFTLHTKSRRTQRDSLFKVSAYPSEQGVVAIIEDITEQEQNKRLSIIGQTAGMVGHDLRNPLQTIIGELYLAKTETQTLPNSPQKNNLQESINTIQEQTVYMDKIVTDLQAFVKPIEVIKRPVDLRTLVEAVLKEINIAGNIIVSTQFPADFLRINADPHLMKRVIINLVTNAVQAMPDGGKLDINSETDQNHIYITVKDTGVGIPENIKPQLFTPLFTTKSRGQGFGLAVCRRVIEAHCGTIEFESQEGKGSKFTVALPV